MEIAAEELLSRFLVHKDDFSPKAGRIRPRAFLPGPKGEVSVCRTQDMTDEEIWDWGTEHVLSRRPENVLHGRAELQASVAFENGLRAIPDEPPPRHAVITGWPEEKDARKGIAADLAARATLALNPGIRA